MAIYWIGYNTAINVRVNLPSDGSLRGGTVQLKAARSTGSNLVFENLGSPVNIPLNNAWVLGDPMDPVTVIVDSVVNGVITGFEELADFGENENFFISAVIDYAEFFFKRENIKYHIIPSNNCVLDLCVHLDKNEDSYELFSRFLGKFDTLVKV